VPTGRRDLFECVILTPPSAGDMLADSTSVTVSGGSPPPLPPHTAAAVAAAAAAQHLQQSASGTAQPTAAAAAAAAAAAPFLLPPPRGLMLNPAAYLAAPFLYGNNALRYQLLTMAIVAVKSFGTVSWNANDDRLSKIIFAVVSGNELTNVH